MKDRALTYLSLILSLIALGHAGWFHQQGSAALADQAVRRREAELVRHWSPRVQVIYRDLLANTSGLPKEPTTLEELLDPLFVFLEQVGEPGTVVTNKLNPK